VAGVRHPVDAGIGANVLARRARTTPTLADAAVGTGRAVSTRAFAARALVGLPVVTLRSAPAAGLKGSLQIAADAVAAGFSRAAGAVRATGAATGPALLTGRAFVVAATAVSAVRPGVGLAASGVGSAAIGEARVAVLDATSAPCAACLAVGDGVAGRATRATVVRVRGGGRAFPRAAVWGCRPRDADA
jgi:hypothetical protein